MVFQIQKLVRSDIVTAEEPYDNKGGNLVHYWRDNSLPSSPWQASAIISTQALSPGSIIQSPFLGPGTPGALNVIVLKSRGLVHYWRDDSTGSWGAGEILENV